MNAWSALATLALAVHLTWIAWVIFGWWVARNRPVLRWFHFGSLIYGILIEIAPWPCPLTLPRAVARIEVRRDRVSGSIPDPLPRRSGIPGCAGHSAGSRGGSRLPGKPVPPRETASGVPARRIRQILTLGGGYAKGQSRRLLFPRIEPSSAAIEPQGEEMRMCYFGEWRYRLTVRTEPSQGLNTGSIPVSATKFS